jgi:hypothetical protein
MHIQVIPGGKVDRLWFCLDEDIYWLPVCVNPKKQVDYLYTSSGTIVGAWLYDNKKDVVKYWDSITLFTEGLSTGHQTITVEYQTDIDTVWHAASAVVTTSPSQQIDFSANYDVTGRRLRYRLTLLTDDPTKSPRIKAVVVNAVERVPGKSAMVVTFLVEDQQQNLQGQYTPLATALARMDKIKLWADSRQIASPLKIHYQHPFFDGRRVFIDRPSVKITSVEIDQKKIALIGRMVLTEK